MDRKFLSLAEAAEALGISRCAAYRWVKSGIIPSIKMGAKILIPVAFVEAQVREAQW